MDQEPETKKSDAESEVGRLGTLIIFLLLRPYVLA